MAINGPTGTDHPHRQGIHSAMLDGRSPLNVLGGIPTIATDYSPLWDLNPYVWTDSAIAAGYRSRLTEEFDILGKVARGYLTGPGGGAFGSNRGQGAARSRCWCLCDDPDTHLPPPLPAFLRTSLDPDAYD